MGFFDFIGDALGAVAMPVTAVIDAGTKLLGLPPVVGDALKVAMGAATGDLITLFQGSTQLLRDLQASAAETEYAPPKDEAYGGTDGWAPTQSLVASSPEGADPVDDPDPADLDPAEPMVSEEPAPTAGDDDPGERQALETLRSSFDALNRDHGFLGAFGDRVITEKELRETSEDPDAPLELKRAARYVLDHPDLLERLSRSADGDDHGIARVDVDLVLQEGGATGSGSAGPAGPATGGDELSALQTILSSFDGLNSGSNMFMAMDKVLSRAELENAASNPDTSPVLKRALRYVLDHPQLLDRLARSRGSDGDGISRSDLQLAIEDAQHGLRSAGPATKPKTPKPSGASPSSSPTKKSSSGSKSKDPSLSDILNDKSLSVEEKIEMILMVLENRLDDQMLDVTQQLDQNDDKKSSKDDRKKVAQLDKVDRDLNFKMERLMKRKEQLSNLLSTMEMKFASMAQTAIANLGR